MAACAAKVRAPQANSPDSTLCIQPLHPLPIGPAPIIEVPDATRDADCVTATPQTLSRVAHLRQGAALCTASPSPARRVSVRLRAAAPVRPAASRDDGR